MNFSSDNTTGACPEIIEAIIRANQGSTSAYGEDKHTKKVTKMINDIFETATEVFLVGTGTAANAIALSTLTKSYGSILCHWDSHIFEDECGSPEFFTSGAKLIPLPGNLSKINLLELNQHSRRGRGDVHMVQPSAVSITQLTEGGTAYSINEIQKIGEICSKSKIKLHMDGARFANALVTLGCTPAEMTWKSGVDVLSFGATKNGALASEAVIFFDKQLAKEFEFRRKRGGHLFSKMRFLACQMEAYLHNDLWIKNARHANSMASHLQKELKKVEKIKFSSPVDGNILFPKIPKHIRNKLLHDGFQFYDNRWGKDVTRLVTSFDTKKIYVQNFMSSIRK